MKTSTKLMTALAAVAIIGTATTTLAANGFGKFHQDMPENRTAIMEAINNNDYPSWSKLVSSKEVFDSMLTRHQERTTEMAEKLGMTADELQTELSSGKTMKDIAEEKGITLKDFKRDTEHTQRGGKRGERGTGEKFNKEGAQAFMAEKLGMTTEELQAAINSGKTMKDIAEEKGVTLTRPNFKK